MLARRNICDLFACEQALSRGGALVSARFRPPPERPGELAYRLMMNELLTKPKFKITGSKWPEFSHANGANNQSS